MNDPTVPRVSVVVPTFKLAHLLPETLKSVKEQTLSQFEVIIVDDGSPDDVRAAAEPFTSTDARFRYVRQENRGLPAARNFGYRHCHADSPYVYFLDADDVLKPRALERLCAHLDAHPCAGMVYCPPQFINELGSTLDVSSWPRGWAFGPRRVKESEVITPFEAVYTITAPIICSIALLRRSAFDVTGGFDEEFGHHREDTNVFIAIALKSEVHYLHEQLVSYRIREGQMSRDTKGLQSQAQRLYEMWRNKTGLSQADLQLLRKAEAFRMSAELEFVTSINGAAKLWRDKQRVLAFRVFAGAIRRRVVARSRLAPAPVHL